jgi:hypothetical protein
LERFGKGKSRQKLYAARMEDWDRFFDTIVRTKTEMKVFNSGMALLTMCQLASERLDQIAAENAGHDDDQDKAA